MVLTTTTTTPSRSTTVRGGVVSLLSIFLLSSTAGLLLFLPSSSNAFTTAPFIASKNLPSAPAVVAARSSSSNNNPRSREWRHASRQSAAAAGTSEEESRVDDGRSLWGGMSAAERARLAQNIAGEFEGRVQEVRETYDARSRQEKASHRVQLAQQRVKLLQGMVPLEAHEAVVESYENKSKEALRQAAASSAAGLSALAGDFSKQQEALHAQLEGRDAALSEASRGLSDMTDALAGLKQDVSSLRQALSSHASRSDEARRALALEIREKEVEPERRRADTAETGLSELRQAAHGWLSTAHALKLEAVAEARASGFSEGRIEGRAEGAGEAEAEVLSLRTEMGVEREAFAAQLALAREERLALREEVLEARTDACEMVAAAGVAGAAALTKSREAWVTQGRAEGFSSGMAEGRAEGLAEGRVLGRADAKEELAAVTLAVEEQEGAVEAKVMLREAFAAYVVSSHEQKLRMMATEREASRAVARGLSEELVDAREVLATLLKERISEIEARRDLALGDFDVAATAVDARSRLDVPELDALWQRGVSVGNAVSAAELKASSPYWQECGGGGSASV